MEWSRPISGGNYPSPKAAASLLIYNNDQLLLYGGYSHPYSYPFNQQVNFFDEMHLYCTKTHIWLQILFTQEAPKLAGHSASILNSDTLILFGGCNGSLGNKTNSVHCFDLNKKEWILNERKIDGFRPEPRYGHSQVTLDDENLLIIGGCGGPGKQYDDLWILNWPRNSTLNARWQKISIENFINSPMQIYCIPFVRISERKLITFGKPRVLNQNSNETSQSLNNLSSSLLNYEFVNSPALTLASFRDGEAVERKCSCFSPNETEKNRDKKSTNQQQNRNFYSLKHKTLGCVTQCLYDFYFITSPFYFCSLTKMGREDWLYLNLFHMFFLLQRLFLDIFSHFVG